MYNISTNKKTIILAIASLFLFFTPSPTFALNDKITIKETATNEIKTLSLTEKNLSLASGDFGIDGISEIITGAGFLQEPKVTLYGQDGLKINEFLAYGKSFDRGIYVAVGDVDGDGTREIVTGTAYGGGPHVRIFDGYGNIEGNFFAYNSAFRGGVFVTVRDLDNDGKAEIITGAGPTGGPHVKVWDNRGILKSEFFAADINDVSGITVSSADIDNDGTPEIITGHASSDPPTISVFKMNGKKIKEFLAFENTFSGGVTPLGLDINNDGREEILVAPNGKKREIKIFNQSGLLLSSIENTSGSQAFNIATIKLNDKKNSILTASTNPLRATDVSISKSIIVNLSEQRLYAYEQGLLANTFLISSGTKKFPTPAGEFKIRRKVPIMDYAWNYGPGNPANYSLPNVKWNLQFANHLYLHYAYWHNNFGNVMSHGCINMPLSASEWIYNWTPVDTPVIVK